MRSVWIALVYDRSLPPMRMEQQRYEMVNDFFDRVTANVIVIGAHRVEMVQVQE